MIQRIVARAAALLLLAGMLAACSAQKDNLVVVLPAADGHIGGVVVQDRHDKTTTVLDKPYAAAGGGAGAADVKAVQVAQGEIDGIFHAALDARPQPPQSFTLYFLSDSDNLTAPSKTAFEEVFGEIKRRRAAEIVVTGHTDSFSSSSYNDSLSLQRAEAVRKMLIARGLPADSVSAVGRGKRELLIPTPDETREPRNRRVVITVR